jgi:hypothetical protein
MDGSTHGWPLSFTDDRPPPLDFCCNTRFFNKPASLQCDQTDLFGSKMMFWPVRVPDAEYQKFLDWSPTS